MTPTFPSLRDERGLLKERLDEEQWRSVADNPNYLISSHGRVQSLVQDKWHKRGDGPFIMKPGKSAYLLVTTLLDGKRTNSYVHQMVAKAFIPNPLNLKVVNHKDCNKHNNHVSNLEWCTRQGNEEHALENGRKPRMRGELNGHARFKDNDIRTIRRRADHGEPISCIAKEFKVAHATIYSIVKRLRWKHIT